MGCDYGNKITIPAPRRMLVSHSIAEPCTFTIFSHTPSRYFMTLPTIFKSYLTCSLVLPHLVALTLPHTLASRLQHHMQHHMLTSMLSSSLESRLRMARSCSSLVMSATWRLYNAITKMEGADGETCRGEQDGTKRPWGSA